MKRKRIFFLTLNYIQIILCVFLISWLFGYKKVSLLDRQYTGLIVFSLLIIFIVNSLSNIFSAKDLISQMPGNKILTAATSIIAFFFILSVGLMLIISTVGFYTYFIERTFSPRFNLGLCVTMLLSIISLIVLVNQYYFRKYLRRENNKKLESEIDIIGLEPSTHD